MPQIGSKAKTGTNAIGLEFRVLQFNGKHFLFQRHELGPEASLDDVLQFFLGNLGPMHFKENCVRIISVSCAFRFGKIRGDFATDLVCALDIY